MSNILVQVIEEAGASVGLPAREVERVTAKVRAKLCAGASMRSPVQYARVAVYNRAAELKRRETGAERGRTRAGSTVPRQGTTRPGLRRGRYYRRRRRLGGVLKRAPPNPGPEVARAAAARLERFEAGAFLVGDADRKDRAASAVELLRHGNGCTWRVLPMQAEPPGAGADGGPFGTRGARGSGPSSGGSLGDCSGRRGFRREAVDF